MVAVATFGTDGRRSCPGADCLIVLGIVAWCAGGQGSCACPFISGGVWRVIARPCAYGFGGVYSPASMTCARSGADRTRSRAAPSCCCLCRCWPINPWRILPMPGWPGGPRSAMRWSNTARADFIYFKMVRDGCCHLSSRGGPSSVQKNHSAELGVSVPARNRDGQHCRGMAKMALGLRPIEWACSGCQPSMRGG